MTFAEIRKTPEWSVRCSQWLDQFSLEEQPTAELLLDSINYISQDEVLYGLQMLVSRRVAECEGTCALYPVTNATKTAGRLILPSIAECAAFPFGAEGGMGSEGDIAHLCRDIAREVGPRVLPHPPFAELRSKRVDHIVVVTDTSSSGDQVADFLGWFWKNRSIRSWHSRKQIRFHVLAYLFTDEAVAAISMHHSKPSFAGVQVCQRGSSLWSPAERDGIEALCMKYGCRKMALGYADMMSLHVFAYSCPNNVPSILRDGTKRCHGLFGRRPTSASSASIAGEAQRLDVAARSFGLRVSTSIALVCHLLRAHPKTSGKLSSELCIPQSSVDRAIAEAVRLGYVKLLKSAYRLTRAGRVFSNSLMRDGPSPANTLTYGPLYHYIPRRRSPVSSSRFAPAEEGAP